MLALASSGPHDCMAGLFPQSALSLIKKKKIADKVKEFLLSLAVMEYIMLGNLVSASSCGEQV